jgi:uncharacterized protein involved in outer membrane biogenesis
MKIPGLKIIFMLIAIVIVVLAAILAIIPIYINPIAQRIVEQKVYPIFQNRLKVGSVNISFFRWLIELKDVELQQPEGFGEGNLLKIASLQSNFEISPFFRNHLPFGNIEIIKPEVTLIITRDEKINTDYIFPKKTGSSERGDAVEATAASSVPPAKESPAPAATDTSSWSFSLDINNLSIKDGILRIYNYKTRSQDPTIVLTELNIEIEDIVFFNTKDTKSSFTITAALTSSQHKSPLNCSGEGLLFKKQLTITAQSKIDNIDLSDYYYFYPDTAVKIQDGNAWVTSKINIKDNYLDSTHHVSVKNLKLTGRDRTLLGKTFLGLPAAGLMKVLEASNGSLEFDFQVRGNFDKIKVKLREKIIQQVAESLAKKVGSLAGNALSTPEKINDFGFKAKDELNKLYNKMK